MKSAIPKTIKEIKIMTEGGKRLGKIKKALHDEVVVGATAGELEAIASKLIKEAGGQASFKNVRDYKWATCINVNDGVVHGIPHSNIVFKDDDVVSVDIGMKYNGYHTDTSFSKLLGKDPKNIALLDSGRRALKSAIKQAKPGKIIQDISKAFETELKKDGLEPIKSLTGHGIGKNLHEPPLIPCYVGNTPDEFVKIVSGMTLAIEIMYTSGKDKLKLEADGWTIRTQDGKIAALFEETVLVSPEGPVILTAQPQATLPKS